MPGFMRNVFTVFLVWLAMASVSGVAAPFTVEAGKPLIQDIEEAVAFNLSIENPQGNVLLSQSKDSKIHLRATTQYKEPLTVEIAGFGSEQVNISVAYPEVEETEIIILGPGETLPSRSVKLEISVPKELLQNLTVGTQNGDIGLHGAFDGEFAKERVLTATTVNGDITAKEFTALAGGTLKTKNGSVKITQLSGALSLTTTNGNIEVDDGTGNISASTRNGDIRVENRTADSVEAGAQSGSVFLNNPKAKKETTVSSN